MIKKRVIGTLILCIAISAVIFYALCTMDVEDRYGDLQNLYWRSRDGDLILNKLNSNVGVVEINNLRIYVKDGERLFDLEDWLDPKDDRKFQAAIYRPANTRHKLYGVKRSDLNSKCKLITEVAVEY